MRSAAAYLEELASLVGEDGGWGYAPGQPSQLEPAALAVLALSRGGSAHQEKVERGLAYLRSAAGEDGVYRLPRGARPEAVWTTAQVLFVRWRLRHLDRDPATEEQLRRSVAALLAIAGNPTLEGQDQDVNDIDGQLIGWPWATGNFSWVEPTSWACLALSALGQRGHPRVQEGLRLLFDRALEAGGANYGNRCILGLQLDPIPAPTALMLIALQGQPDQTRIPQAVAYLRGKALEGDDVENLCWARLALDLYRDHEGVTEGLTELARRIDQAWESRQSVSWARPSPLRLALTVLALGIEEGNVFRLDDAVSGERVTPVAPAMPKKGLGERVRGFFRGLAVNAAAQLRPLEPQVSVHVAPASDYNADLADVLKRQYESFRAQVPLRGKRVVLKPNLVEFHRDKVINTNPNVVAAAIELCRHEGAEEVIVAEGPGHWRNTEYLVAASGLGDVLRHYRVPFVDINLDEPVRCLNMGRLTRLDHLYLSQTVVHADVLISMPRLKTHHWAVATLSLKNLFGTLPGMCYGWPKNELHWRGIDNSIVDIAMTRTPDLAIVDGIVGMEGDGPLNGTARHMGVLVMGTDLLAVDATCCRLMRLDPEKVGYLVLGARKKLGRLAEGHIQQIGETLADRAQPFATVPHFEQVRLKTDRAPVAAGCQIFGQETASPRG